MAIEKERFEGARFRVEANRLTTALTRKMGPRVAYCSTEAERDALVQSHKEISGSRKKVTVTDLTEESTRV